MPVNVRHVGLVMGLALLCMSAGAASDEQAGGYLACNPTSDLGPVGEYLQPGTAVLIGEMHGTRESPQFVSDLVCSALKAHRKVAVALEIPGSEAPALQDSSPALRIPSHFTDDPFWTKPYQDGRSSMAMRDLIDQLRTWQGGSVSGETASVRLLTIGSGREVHGDERDREMAARLAADMKAHKDYVYLALMGNIHNRLDRGIPWDREYTPMGLALTRLVSNDTPIVSLANRYYEGGTAHVCEGRDVASCGEVALDKEPRTASSTRDQAPRGVRISSVDANLIRGYYYFTRPVTFSPPVRSRSGPSSPPPVLRGSP
jgi:hypothetical protein